MRELENNTGFKSDDEFKEYVNFLSQMTEDIEYEDNHPDKKIAIAMETVIQIGNAWDEGLRELSPNMKVFLQTSLNILSSCENKTQQINGLIRVGNYYLNNMDVIVVNDTTLDPLSTNN